MNKKLFYILIATLPAYGSILSILNANGLDDGLLVPFNGFILLVVLPLVGSLTLDLWHSVDDTLRTPLFNLQLIISNLVFWIPASFLISFIPFKKIFSRE